MQIIFKVLILVLLFLPMSQYFTGVLPRASLVATALPRVPQFRVKSFWRGRYQRRFEDWFMKNSGVWEALLTTNNQISYQVFQQLNSEYFPDHGFMVGNQHALFQSMYLRDFNGDREVEHSVLEGRILQIAKLQKLMRAKGKALLVVISVNKLSLHPEFVPNLLRRPMPGIRNIEIFRALAAKHGLEFLDTGRELERLKETQDYPLYNALAAHWNSVTNCFVSKRIIELTQAMLNRKLTEITCSSELEISERPLGADKDLIEVLNVWDASSGFRPTPYTKALVVNAKNTYNPRMLFVGTSFLWSVLRTLEGANIYNERDFFYYGRTNHFAYRGTDGRSQKGTRRVDYKNIDWQKQVLDKDVIVLEINEARLPDLGFTFVEKLFQYAFIHTSTGSFSSTTVLNSGST